MFLYVSKIKYRKKRPESDAFIKLKTPFILIQFPEVSLTKGKRGKA